MYKGRWSRAVALSQMELSSVDLSISDCGKVWVFVWDYESRPDRLCQGGQSNEVGRTWLVDVRIVVWYFANEADHRDLNWWFHVAVQVVAV